MRLTEALLLAIDAETTGPDPLTDRIVELGGAYFYQGELWGRPKRALVNPNKYIPTGATHVHRIKNEDVEGAPTWAEIGTKFKAHLVTHRPILVGYNLFGFDGPLINAENTRENLDWRLPRFLDAFVFVYWHHRDLRSRKLSAICEYYGLFLPESRAHSADADSLITGFLVLQMVRNQTIPDDVEGAFTAQAELRRKLEAERVRFGRYLYEDRQNGALCVGLGKHTGTPLAEVDHDYLRWVIGRPDLPDEARHAVLRILGRTEQIGLL